MEVKKNEEKNMGVEKCKCNKGDKCKNSTLTILLSIICMCLALFIFVNRDKLIEKEGDNLPLNDKSEVNDKVDNVTVDEPLTNSFPIVKVKNLQEKLRKLDFSDKTSCVATEGSTDDPKFTAYIENGRVNIEAVRGETNNKYTVEGIENAKSVGAGFSVQGSGMGFYYILTKDGKVYMLEESANKVADLDGKVVDLGIKGATSIAVVDQNFNLNDEAMTTSPTVYVKTSDGKLLTDEFFLGQSGIVEVVEE